MQLEFGDGADADTFETFFAHLTQGYVVRLNGKDTVIYATRPEDLNAWAHVPDGTFKPDVVGLYGFEWSDGGSAADLAKPHGAAWDAIVEVLIY